MLARSVFLASAAPAAAFALVSPLLDQNLTFKLIILNFFGAFLVSACHTVALGLPAAFVLHRTGLLTFGSLAAAGFSIGVLPTAGLLLIQWVTEPSLSLVCQSNSECQAALAASRAGPEAIFVVLAVGGLGVLAALSFYASYRASGLFNRAT